MPKIFLVNYKMREQSQLLEQEKGLNFDSGSSDGKSAYLPDYRTLKHYKSSRWNWADSRPTDEYSESVDLRKPDSNINKGLDLSKPSTSKVQEDYSKIYDSTEDEDIYERCQSPFMEQDEPLSLTVKDRIESTEEPETPKKDYVQCPPSVLPSVTRFLPTAKLAACYSPFQSTVLPYTSKPQPPQESPLDFHVPRRSVSPPLPPFKDVRKRRNGLKSFDKNYYAPKEDERDSLLPYDLSMRKDKPPRSISPQSLPPYMESMKLSHCNNGSGYQCNGESPSGQQGYTGETSYANISQMSPLTFFGAASLGLKEGSGGGGGGDGEDGENPREFISSPSYSSSSNVPALVEPQVSPLPEHCESLNASDRSLAFPAPAHFRDISKFTHEEQLSPQEIIQEIRVETQYSQTQVQLQGDHIQPISSLPLSPPLSCSLSPPSTGVSPTLLSAVNDRQPFDSVSSQTQVPLVSSTEIQLSSNWNEKGPLSPPYNGNSNYISRPPSANGSISSIQDFQDVPFQVRVSLIQQRLGLPEETPIEFVNGGHGIKNPLISQDRLNELEKQPPQVLDEDPSKFVCRVCSKVFGLQRLLNRHMKCHSDLKRYLCTFCGKGFNDTFDLKRHTRTHTGVRPYKCSLCEKSFTQRCSLESHCLKVHGVQHNYSYKERRTKMYVCEECGNTTPEPEKHYVHLKEYHPQSPALQKFYDKRHFKFHDQSFPNLVMMGD